MRVLLDDNLYVMAYTLESVDTQGNEVGEASGIEVSTPKDLDHFQQYFNYYHLVYNDVVFDYEKYEKEFNKIRVVLDDSGYVMSYATIGNLDNSIEVDRPNDLDYFAERYKAFCIGKKGELVFDEKKWVEVDEDNTNDSLRLQRERECFKYINRGQLWYASLTKDQLEELKKWYNDWLNVTENKKSVPTKPKWLN